MIGWLRKLLDDAASHPNPGAQGQAKREIRKLTPDLAAWAIRAADELEEWRRFYIKTHGRTNEFATSITEELLADLAALNPEADSDAGSPECKRLRDETSVGPTCSCHTGVCVLEINS